LWFNI